ncbi:unnamed protein product [Rotaria socialis]|uniref:NHL repeat-containing protein 2 n=2 Tax=Rotaria socialis TaxID=392032 RepID=A0A818X0J2_9BILA|nr:unnamed protein product [Rotaria socialis]CAF3732475.1 unnamed protein product [Rotaria socialis]CAF4322508.1 unnamed protein product [Rotaria socialis]CAF4508228.1 unnamed protein product [Rotaria socialis]
MSVMNFNTDLFRDLTFDLLSDISHDSTKFDELNQSYLNKIHERIDGDELIKYTREFYEKILSLQIVQTNRRAQLKDLMHGNIVIVYFWTFSDIQVSHTIHKVIGIDKRYSSADVTVICVHSPKYDHEKNKANIMHDIEERSLPFTVVDDSRRLVWKHVDCQLWPTVLVFGPDSLPIYIFEGENHVQHLERFLVPVFTHYKSSLYPILNNSLATTNSSENVATIKAASKVKDFRYPSHICVTSNEQLYISFAGSNQLVLCDIDGKVIDIIGNRNAGMADGDINQAEFDSPHGLAEFNSCIYIADTNNHSIRVFDPNSRRVLTMIGTGRLGTDKIGGLQRTQQPIASPWDLCITESPFDSKIVLLISMAGHHQIWAYAFEETQWWNDVILKKNSCSSIIGSGFEENKNSSEPMSAGLASPRGICNGIMNEEPVIFIADSNSSTIRVVTLNDGHVANLVGGVADPTNLAAFGDLDGTGHHAKLQYPIGVAFHYPSSYLYITDTFNNKLKRVDMKTLLCSSYFATDDDMKKKRGETNSSKFYEPYGIAILDHFLYVADKNNSYIKRIDLDHGTIIEHRFYLSEILNEERSFGSKQAYLAIFLDDALKLRDGNAGTWTIEDEDGLKICDGELICHVPDQILLDYVSCDKQVRSLKYELMVCQDNKCTMMNGVVQPVNQTDSIIEFIIKIGQIETTKSS